MVEQNLKNSSIKNDAVIAVTGKDGRANALLEAYAKSPFVKKLIAIPGNDASGLVTNGKPTLTFQDIKIDDLSKIIQVCQQEQVTLLDVAQDRAVQTGLVNLARENQIKVFGPTKQAGIIEWNKVVSRNIMQKAGVPIPRYHAFLSKNQAYDFLSLKTDNRSFVIKIAELFDGKGVFIAESIDQAYDIVSNLPQDQESKNVMPFLIEEKVGGPNAIEFSGYYNCYFNQFKTIGFAKDYKRIGDNDTGPNTGGVGSIYHPSFLSDNLKKRIEDQAIRPTLKQLSTLNIPYTGILYLGGMYDPDIDKFWVIEYNARWGDPEAEVVIPSITSDFYTLINKSITGELPDIELDQSIKTLVTLCRRDYPQNNGQSPYDRFEIPNLDQLINESNITIYGSGIKRANNKWYPYGGRVLHVVGKGLTLESARELTYQSVKRLTQTDDISHALYYRTDIARYLPINLGQ